MKQRSAARKLAGACAASVAPQALRAGALWALAFGVLAAACEPADNTPVGRGARVFQRTCSGCHGADGRGVQRLGLLERPRDLTNPAFHAEVTDEQLLRVIRTGKKQMPAFGGLIADQDLRNVVAFIRTLPPGARSPKPSSAMPAAPPAPGPLEPGSAEPTSAPPSAQVVPPHASEPKGTVQ